MISFFFFFNDTATTEIYTLSLHDALPIYIWYTLSQRSGSDLLEGLKVPEGGLDTGVVDDEVELGPVGRRLGNVRRKPSLGNEGWTRRQPLVHADVEEPGVFLQLLPIPGNDLIG